MVTSDAPSWQAAFVAATVALGDAVSDARDALAPADQAIAAPVLDGLTDADRSVRARTLAAALAQIAAELERARFA